MSNRTYIERVVNTAGRPCPMMGKKCPGNEKGCAWWVVERIQDGASEDIQSGCLFAFNYVVANSIQLEMIRMQAGFDKVATEARRTAVAILAPTVQKMIERSNGYDNETP